MADGEMPAASDVFAMVVLGPSKRGIGRLVKPKGDLVHLDSLLSGEILRNSMRL